MRHRTHLRPDDTAAARRWRIGLLASLGGTLFGVVIRLYSTEVRTMLDESGRGFTSNGLPYLVTALVASGSGVVLYELLFRRHQRASVVTGEIPIRTDALLGIVHEEDAVVGRVLRYLEVRRHTEDLVVFLPGLGLDADDFRPYLAESRFHCVALTLYGFNAAERDDEQYRPISLRSHAQLIGYALAALQRRYHRKRITLVGFSFGGDMILLLPELLPDLLAELRLHRVVLLDPNVNSTTTTISSRIAAISGNGSLRDLAGILRSARNPSEFRYRAAYLNKITSKNFAHVHRHAQEVVDRYRQRSFGPFLDAVGQLDHQVGRVEVVLSLNHEAVLNAVARAAAQRGLDPTCIESSGTHHFDLLNPEFLRRRLEGT